ncbi:MAG: hydroxylamine reductase, partial [Firmicutes bacterium]|nr:hydroxylamine reductase [Bacillota bacterium]
MENQMLCYQCGCAKDGKYCNDTVGSCGKSAETSRLQDELTGALVGLAKASVNKSIDEDIQRLVVEGLAATSAHTDFDDEKIMELTEKAKAAKTKFVPKFGGYNTSLKLPDDFDIRIIWQKSPDIRSLKSLLLFGIRGIALYAYESWALGSKNREAASFFHKALIALGANHFKEDYYDLLNEMGGIALRAMEQANKARTNTYGQPGPVDVPRVIDPGPFIIVSGHNFEILGDILEATKDSGINIYSHGEMLPAHAYPEFRKYRHFKGHYGTAWQNQQSEFDCIPAAIIFTSGCMSLPLPSYIDRVFTAGIAHIGGVPHLEGDYTPAMIRSIELGGAPEPIAFPGVNGGTSVKTGFGKKSVRTISYKLAAALNEGTLHHIYVVGGCDGMEENRRDYTDMIRRIPSDAVVLTWGCTKYRFNDIDFGAIDGVPRIIDLGMCSDMPIVIEVVEAIAESAKLRVDELPLTFHFTWQESRSTAAIFALFAADVQKVVLGPTLPPFFTEDVFRAVAKDYSMTLMESERTSETDTYEPVFSVVKETAEEPEPIKEEEPAEVAIPTAMGATQATYTAEELEERSEAAGLPAWAMVDDDEEEEEEVVVIEEEPKQPKIRPEDLDQSPAWLSADDDDEDDITAVPEEPVMDIEARSAAAGLPAWAMEDDDDEEEVIVAEEVVEEAAPVERTASFAEILALREEKGDTDDEEEYEEEEVIDIPEPVAVAAPKAEEMPVKKDILIEDTAKTTLGADAPKVVIPKGKGVSGWKDPDDEPAFTPGERKPYKYTPPKELVEIPQPPPIALPAGAGVSGFAANHDGDSSTDSVLKNDRPGGLYAFAEAQPEIKIPKGKGVSGWKESDDEIKPVKRNSDSEGGNAKPWLKQSLEKLHAEVEEANAPATPISSAVAPEPAPVPAAQGQTVAEEPAAPAIEVEEHSDKPWLAASIKNLKESIAADEAAEANKNSDKPWLAASLSQLHAEVEAEKNGGNPPATTAPATEDGENEEAYVSKYKHDPNAAADKPWLKASIEELKNSIDAEAGIKSVRSEKKGP